MLLLVTLWGPPSRKLAHFLLLCCSTSMALGECGRYFLCSTYCLKCVKYWCHLLYMNQNRYKKNCYLMLKSHTELGRNIWASNVRDLLYRFGFGFVWLSQDVRNVTVFLQELRQRVIDCSAQDWHEQVSTSAKCEHYKHFKTMLNAVRYVSFNLLFYIRKAVAKFRCSNHALNIEVGRHAGIPREYRSCSYCLRNNSAYYIEDELHAFFQCRMYDDIRQQYLPKDLCNSKSLFNSYNILGHSDCNVIRKISNFIFYMLKKRNSITSYFVLMSECVSGIFWCFFKQDYLLFSSRGRLMKMFLLGTQSLPYALAKNQCILECIAILLAADSFVCSREASHRDVSFEQTEHTLWRKISAYWSVWLFS